MDIKNELPPNYAEIKEILDPPFDSIFAYGSTIYNPSERDLYPDDIVHEEVHQKQQGKNPDIWCKKYLHDRQFRQECEVEAYAAQYRFLKEKVKMLNSDLKEALYGMAHALSHDYNLDLDYHKAESLIRNYGK